MGAVFCSTHFLYKKSLNDKVKYHVFDKNCVWWYIVYVVS